MIPLQTASRHPVSHILFSPDGSAVAVAQPHSGVTLLDRATGRTLAVCAMPRRAELSGLTFCGEGRFLAASHAKGVEVFDTATGKRVLADFHDPEQDLLLADRGDAVLGAAVRYGTARYGAAHPTLLLGEFGVRKGAAKAVFYRNDFTITALAPDGSRVLGTERGRHLLLDVGTGRVVAGVEPSAPGEPPAATVARFCPLGRRFALNDGRTLAVYDPGGPVEEDGGDQHADTPLVQRAGGTPAAVAPMPHVRLSPTLTLEPDKPGGEDGWYPPFALLADGRGVLVRRPRNRVQLWDAPTGTLASEWSWRLEWVTCVAVSPDGLTAVAGGRFGRVLLWDLDP